jgi:hypothetical protein
MPLHHYDQYCQLIQQGYVDIPSPSDSQRVYRVPKLPRRVQVREKGKFMNYQFIKEQS